MRYFLIVVGLLGALFGSNLISSNPVTQFGLLFVQAGAIFLAVGLATVDIVEAIKSKRQ